MDNESLKFSLILATLGRVSDLERFLLSLDAQSYRNFELLIVDQNNDDRLVPMILHYRRKFTIHHIRSEKGLSHARNVGLKEITGDIVAFPDDDCWYPYPDVLKNVVHFFDTNPDMDGFTGRSDDGNGLSDCRWLTGKAILNKVNVWVAATSFTIFLRRTIVEKVGQFDETLGVGSGTVWGAGEELDYMLRALAASASIAYDPDLIVFHPYKAAVRTDEFISRVRSYARSAGKVLSRNAVPVWYLFYMNFRSLGGLLLSLVKRDYWQARLYHASICGRFRGYVDGLSPADVAPNKSKG